MREFEDPEDIEELDEEPVDLPEGPLTFGDEPEIGPIGAILASSAENRPEVARLFQDVQTAKKSELERSLQQLGSEMQDITLYHPNRRDAAISEIREKWIGDFENLASLEHQDRMEALNKLVYGLKISEDRISVTQIKHNETQSSVIPKSPISKYMDGIERRLLFSDASFAFMSYILDLFDHPTSEISSLQTYLAQGNVREGLLDAGPYGREVKLPRLLEAFSHWVNESK